MCVLRVNTAHSPACGNGIASRTLARPVTAASVHSKPRPARGTVSPAKEGAAVAPPAQGYFAACALSAAMSASVRSVITPIWLVR